MLLIEAQKANLKQAKLKTFRQRAERCCTARKRRFFLKANATLCGIK
jgi:hypothetical protein